MNIQWYPGHMTKAKREILESLKMVDMAIELLDARVPGSSRNPDIDAICSNKPRLVVLNKSDLADKNSNKLWTEYFRNKGLPCLEIDSLSGKGTRNIADVVAVMFKERNERLRLKGIISKPVRVLIIGIPNVGKSSLINRLSGRAITKTGDKPGVTKGRQWIKIGPNLELLDTPGILWPKFEDVEVGINLAITGAIRDEVLDTIELSIMLIDKLKIISPLSISERYKVKNIEADTPDILNEIGKNRGAILSGGVVDTDRISKVIIDEFRAGKLGKITLEKP